MSSLWADDLADASPGPPADGPVLAVPRASSAAVPPATVATRRRPARQRPVVVDVLAGLTGLGLGATIALGVLGESSRSLSADGGLATAAGRLTGLVAAYAMVVVVLLVARVAPLERAIGQDRLVRWHRKLGPWPLYLLGAHGILITVGYAQAAHDGLLHQLWQLVWTYPGILASAVATVLLVSAGVSSYRKARRRMAYETWWSVHLYTYLALFLSFSHQVNTGASFVGHPSNRAWWTALWVGTLAVVLVSRVGTPVWRSLRHRVRVVGVRREGPGVVSVVLEGRRLDRLPVGGGQFLQWRFLRRGQWWQAHPYSLSAVPTSSRMRITVKDLGDHSRWLAAVRPGTWVAVEGPYGAFTPDARKGEKVLLVGAGVGSTPIRAVLEDLPPQTDVVVVLRASDRAGLVLRDEFARHVRDRGGRLHELVGPRDRVPLDTAGLRALVPDLAERDVYVCGPDGFTGSVADAAHAAGVDRSRIHHESFAF
jgi:ferredoxin-NADP reductase/DMSO/TMAO reductase YedYZ heme-binding membrane subunit